MNKKEMKRIQREALGHVCNYCLSHPTHIATVQQIEYLKREYLIKQNETYKANMYDKDQYLEEIKQQRELTNDLIKKLYERGNDFLKLRKRFLLRKRKK